MPPNSLSIIVPMYQEAENIAPLIDKVHQGLTQYPGDWELICVDDGSRDDTAERIRQAAQTHGDYIRLIRLHRNFGQTAAMQAGFNAARGEFIATLDGDLQNDPADIPRMLQELQQRDLDLLQGWRKKRKDPPLRKFFSRIANRLIVRATGVDLHDYGCSLKVYRAKVIKQVNLFGEMHRFIPIWVAGVTAPSRIGETIVNHHARQFGQSKYGFSRTFRVITDLLTVFFFLRFRARPGHFFGAIGLLFGALGSIGLAYLGIIKFILGEAIGGRPLLFISILFAVMSIQFLTTGVLAELLSRTFYESNGRDAFHIAEMDQGDAWHSPSNDKPA